MQVFSIMAMMQNVFNEINEEAGIIIYTFIFIALLGTFTNYFLSVIHSQSGTLYKIHKYSSIQVDTDLAD